MPFGLDLRTAIIVALILLFGLPLVQGMLAKRRTRSTPA
jgi:hypothetical protein